MGTTEELISQAVKTSRKLIHPEKAKQYEEMLSKILSNNQSPLEVCGFTPEILEAFYGCAQCLYTSGKYKDAGIIFNLLTYLNVNEYKYVMGCAASAHMQKNYLDALTHYNSCFFLDPSNPLPNYHASDCYRKLNSPTLAIQCLNAAILQAGDNTAYTKLKERAQLTKDAIQKESSR
jgi:type III secretion system low calcium response chaperone LcrH/SycD